MQFKRMIRGGRREYRKHGISSLFGLMAWYVSSTFAPNLRSFYYTNVYDRDIAEYDLPIDPYRLTWVGPDQINYKSARDRPKWASFATNLGSVRTGDWDLDVGERFTYRHESFKRHFEEGVPWEDTQFYEKSIDEIANGGYGMRMATSEEEVIQRCHEIDELYRRIKNEGYRTQEELNPSGSTIEHLGNEIQVDIGRDGTLLFVEGRHRLSIAKILDVEAVPVTIVCRHEEWVTELEDRYQRDDPIEHPDWNNVIA